MLRRFLLFVSCILRCYVKSCKKHRRTAEELKAERPTANPTLQHWYQGMRVMRSINRDKDYGFVTGVEAERLRRKGLGFRVVNDLGAEFEIYPSTDKHYRTCYPMHPAYAVNVSQMQKETLDHMTMWLDTEHAPAAIYIALSRVRRKNMTLCIRSGWQHITSDLPGTSDLRALYYKRALHA